MELKTNFEEIREIFKKVQKNTRKIRLAEEDEIRRIICRWLDYNLQNYHEQLKNDVLIGTQSTLTSSKLCFVRDFDTFSIEQLKQYVFDVIEEKIGDEIIYSFSYKNNDDGTLGYQINILSPRLD